MERFRFGHRVLHGLELPGSPLARATGTRVGRVKHRGGGTNRNKERMECTPCTNKFKRWCRKKEGPAPVRGRFKLRKPLRAYKRPVKCPTCKSENVRSIEKERRREYEKRDICRCAPIPFPHLKGSITGCDYHPAGHEREWDELDQAKYEDVIRTPRTEDG